ncbi:hypothetical protein [Cellulomonas endophytica]|uniref:hypothetical protein n=1 Tax=Cellulomonas endophytica TaxID=2494735 RepID=UPI001010ED84|nr:hypothetical protein [Cellulomonas endophytica]
MTTSLLPAAAAAGATGTGSVGGTVWTTWGDQLQTWNSLFVVEATDRSGTAVLDAAVPEHDGTFVLDAVPAGDVLVRVCRQASTRDCVYAGPTADARLADVVRVVAGGASAVPSAIPRALPDLWTLPYTSDLVWTDGRTLTPVTYEQWRSMGFDPPQRAHTSYRRFAWSATVYAVTEVWSFYWHRWVTASRALTAAEWARAGRPAPAPASGTEPVPGMRTLSWSTSPELFAVEPDGRHHRLTFAEWQGLGAPDPVASPGGFVRLSWDGTGGIGRQGTATDGSYQPLTYSEWVELGSPTPAVAARFPGDLVHARVGGSDLHYRGPSLSRRITYDEWRLLGSPEPMRFP